MKEIVKKIKGALKNKENNNYPIATMIIVLLNVAFFVFARIVENISGFVIEEATAMYWFKSPNFHWTQIITSFFSHGSWSHLIGNMFFLLAFGTFLEKIVGKWKFTFFYFVSGIISGLVPIICYTIGIEPVLAMFEQFFANPSPEAMEQIFGIPRALYLFFIRLLQAIYDMLLVGPASLGASGAISAVMGYSLLKYGNRSILKGSFVKAWMLIAIFIYKDAYIVINDILENGWLGGCSGQMAHLSGYIVGGLFILLDKIKLKLSWGDRKVLND